jgi:hypothetical protein
MQERRKRGKKKENKKKIKQNLGYGPEVQKIGSMRKVTLNWRLVCSVL